MIRMVATLTRHRITFNGIELLTKSSSILLIVPWSSKKMNYIFWKGSPPFLIQQLADILFTCRTWRCYAAQYYNEDTWHTSGHSNINFSCNKTLLGGSPFHSWWNCSSGKTPRIVSTFDEVGISCNLHSYSFLFK